MNDLELVFWGFTLADLALAAGRYLMLVSAALLAIKNTAWLTRWGGRDRRAGRQARLAAETVFALVIVAIYAHHLYFGGADTPAAVTALGRAEAGAVAWVVAGILITLVLTRRDDRPTNGDPREHHHTHDHHHEHEHRNK